MDALIAVLVKFLETFLLALIPLLVPIVAAWVIAQIRSTWQRFKSTQSESNLFLLKEIATLAVRAAEQSGANLLIHDKKSYAVGVAEDYLAARGITINLSLIEAAIEAAVLEEFSTFELEEPELPE